MKLCVDIDNVVANTDVIIREIIATHTCGRVCLSYENIVHFNYFECPDGNGRTISRDDWELVHNSFSERSNILRIRPMEGALDCLSVLGRRFEVHLVTTRLPQARAATAEWIEFHKLPKHSLHFVHHRQKHSTLAGITAALEDDYDQAVSFVKEADTPCFLFEHPWNAQRPRIDGITWVRSWSEAVKHLDSLSG